MHSDIDTVLAAEWEEIKLVASIAAQFAAVHPDGIRDMESCTRALELVQTVRELMVAEMERRESEDDEVTA